MGDLNAATFWLTLVGGMIWAVGGGWAFTGTHTLGAAKAFRSGAPLTIIVGLFWGALVFQKFVNITPGTRLGLVAATVPILIGVLLIILPKTRTTGAGAQRLVARSTRCGRRRHFVGQLFYSGQVFWGVTLAGAFPLARVMAVGGFLRALQSRQSWKLGASNESMRSPYGRALEYGQLRSTAVGRPLSARAAASRSSSFLSS